MKNQSIVLICSWCQKTASVSSILNYTTITTEYFICPDCLIPMMPASLEETDTTMSATNKGEESRENPRFNLFTQIRLAAQKSGVQQASALVLNTSNSGLKIETKIAVEKNDLISLRLIGENQKFAAMGKVAYSTSINDGDLIYYQAGIQLLQILDF